MIIHVHSYTFDREEFKAYFFWWMSTYGHQYPEDTSTELYQDFYELKSVAVESGIPEKELFQQKKKDGSI